MSVSVVNKDLAGWRVEAMEPLRFHVSDASTPAGYKSVHLATGALGILSGDIRIYYADANVEAAEVLARDAARLRNLLEHSERFPTLRNAANYIGAAHALRGEDFLAATIQLDVAWDAVPADGAKRGKFFAFLPWLRLTAAK
jgi:hypothetical protein